MRVGQYVQWKSLVPDSKRVFAGIIRCLEHALDGWAVVEDEMTGRWNPISRKRLIVPKPPPTKDARGGGKTPAGAAALMAEVA